MIYGMTESFTLISMLIFGAVTKSYITRMFKSNSGEPYAGKLHVRFLEEFISNCLIIREGENLLMRQVLPFLRALLLYSQNVGFQKQIPMWQPPYVPSWF